MVKIPPPFFVIRNAIHSSSGINDEVNLPDVDNPGENDKLEENEDEDEDQNDELTSVPIVHLVEAPRGMYMLDFCHENESFMADFLAENEMRECNNKSGDEHTYVDGKAWRHLEAYSILVGEPIVAKGNNDEEVLKEGLCLNLNSGVKNDQHEGYFILLEDAVKDVIHTLLPIDSLFQWNNLVDARNQGNLQWKDIRTFLSEVRNRVPFLTSDGVLRRVVNTHITFHQFVAFSRLVESYLKFIATSMTSQVGVPDVKIYDIFPSFDSMAPEEQIIELLASIKDKASRERAQASGLVIPASADDLVSVVECNEEWRRYVQWWVTDDEIRNDFCMRELLFAESQDEVRRNAEKGRISMRGRHSKDLFVRERFLRRFGTWYLGLDDSVRDEAIDETVPSIAKPASLHTYDFVTGRSSIHVDDLLARSSPLKLPDFQNKSWRPSLVEEQDGEAKYMHGEDDSSLKPLLVTTIDSRPSSIITQEAPIVRDMPTVEGCLSQKQSRRCDAITLVQDNDPALNIVSKKKSKENPISFRRHFLRRLTSDIESVTSVLNRKGGSKLRGVELFRSKVRLVMMIQTLSLWKSVQQLEAFALPNVDIFHFEAVARALPAKPKRPVTPKKAKPDYRINKELMGRAELHHQHALCGKAFNAMDDWKRQMLIKKQKQLEKEKRMREEEQQRREREQQLREKAQQIREKVVAGRLRKYLGVFRDHAVRQNNAGRLRKCLQRLRDHAMKQKNERNKEKAVEETVEIVEEEAFLFVAPPPNVEKDRFSLEDKRSLDFRSHCRKLFAMGSTSLFDELDCMELTVGRNRRSGLDVVDKDEYDQHFANAIELKKVSSQPMQKKWNELVGSDRLTKDEARKVCRGIKPV
mmetsp:Transcript_23779/g.49764  ORF Transcript_23779/g.49764 Transcript_23779/m.49764 type:complete len:866 (+) Transcript_23779:73-2670(+)